uniref:Uncharacterized protein n=1 Tax=viral metagenome TaxID=1070528 RepID=A0A6M3LX11_9ZZZZ
MAEATVKRMSYEAFVKAAIQNLRTEKSKGIHTVYSGFNSAFRKYYGEDSNPIEACKTLAEQAKIQMRLAKGGAQIFLYGEATIRDNSARADDVLKRIVG